MENREIIAKLWERDLDDPKVLDYLLSMAITTEDGGLAVRVWNESGDRVVKWKNRDPERALKF